MLQIDIVGISANGNLVLEVNGRPNKGNSTAIKNEDVHWKVKPGSEVEYINDIIRKPIIGSEDIFSQDPPSPQNPNKKHWKSKVNNNAEDYAIYIYNIEWVDTNGDKHPYDPIISIRPRAMVGSRMLAPIATFAFGLLVSFFYWRQDRIKLKKKIEYLERNK